MQFPRGRRAETSINEETVEGDEEMSVEVKLERVRAVVAAYNSVREATGTPDIALSFTLTLMSSEVLVEEFEVNRGRVMHNDLESDILTTGTRVDLSDRTLQFVIAQYSAVSI